MQLCCNILYQREAGASLTVALLKSKEKPPPRDNRGRGKGNKKWLTMNILTR